MDELRIVIPLPNYDFSIQDELTTASLSINPHHRSPRNYDFSIQDELTTASLSINPHHRSPRN